MQPFFLDFKSTDPQNLYNCFSNYSLFSIGFSIDLTKNFGALFLKHFRFGIWCFHNFWFHLLENWSSLRMNSTLIYFCWVMVPNGVPPNMDTDNKFSFDRCQLFEFQKINALCCCSFLTKHPPSFLNVFYLLISHFSRYMFNYFAY